MDLCMQMYGEYHILTSRLYINIGIVYEDNSNYKKAYEYFKKWARVSEEILGPEHPKTQRAKGVLRETRYRQIARDLGESDSEEVDEPVEQEDEDEEEIENPDLEHYYDDPISQGSGQAIQLDNSLIESNNANVIEVISDNADNTERNDAQQIRRNDESSDSMLMNGYFEERSSGHDSGSNQENSDNENFYDDNFEDYEEHYILHSDSGPVIDDFNIHVEEDEEDDEIVQISARDVYDNDLEADNRYASDSHEESDDEDSEPVNRHGHHRTGHHH